MSREVAEGRLEDGKGKEQKRKERKVVVERWRAKE